MSIRHEPKPAADLALRLARLHPHKTWSSLAKMLPPVKTWERLARIAAAEPEGGE